MKVFKQAITRFANIIIPEKIIISQQSVTWEKRNKNLINKDCKSFELSTVCSVEINTGWFGSSVIIRNKAGDSILMDKLTLNDAKEIKTLIEHLQQAPSHPTSIADEIAKLQHLLFQGAITQAEFNQMKKKLIDTL